MDPLVEKHFDNSPYAYVYNNPIKLIDPFGLDSTFYNEAGNQIYTCGDDPNSDVNFVVKTTQTTREMYSEDPSNPEAGNSNPISSELANYAENELANGNVTGDHMENLVHIPNPEAGANILGAIGDDGTGGNSAANNTEYATNVNSSTNETYATTQGEPGDPSVGGVISVDSRMNHSHPSGTNKGARWQQPPSRTDIQNAPAASSGYTKNVWGMRSGKVYIYNKSGVVGTVPQSIYKK